MPKNWCFRNAVLEKTLESPLGQQGSQISQSYRKSTLNIHWMDWCWSWSSVLWPSDVKSRLIGKDPDAGKERRQEKGTTENEIIGWHHQLSGHKFEQTSGDGEGQGSLVCCSPWGHKESDTTEWLNNINYFLKVTWKMTVKSSDTLYFFSGILEIEGNA